MLDKEKILDDLARMAGETVSLLQNTGKQVNASMKSRVDDWAQNMNLVPREDFERLELMLTQARQEQDAMKKRIEALESALGMKAKAAPKTKSKSKPTPKTKTKTKKKAK